MFETQTALNKQTQIHKFKLKISIHSDHQWNSKPEFVVCTHRVVSFSDVMKHMRKNNGTASEEVDEMKTHNSDLMATSSIWSSKSSKAPKSYVSQASPNVRIKKPPSYRQDSDSASMSADSPCDSMSHHSMLTQHSSVSQVRKFQIVCPTSLNSSFVSSDQNPNRT